MEFVKKPCRASAKNPVTTATDLRRNDRIESDPTTSNSKTLVITTQNSLDQLAVRLQRAYERRHPHWLSTGLTPGVWTAAASRLLDVGVNQPKLPIDPELFVAVQDYKTFRRDPWRELTQAGSSHVYRQSILQIVKQLKVELRKELRWARRYLEKEGSLDQMLACPRPKVSPLVKLLLCHQQNRPELAVLVRTAAEAQQKACPLYDLACNHLSLDQIPLRSKGTLMLSPFLVDQEDTYVWN